MKATHKRCMPESNLLSHENYFSQITTTEIAQESCFPFLVILAMFSNTAFLQNMMWFRLYF